MEHIYSKYSFVIGSNKIKYRNIFRNLYKIPRKVTDIAPHKILIKIKKKKNRRFVVEYVTYDGNDKSIVAISINLIIHLTV